MFLRHSHLSERHSIDLEIAFYNIKNQPPDSVESFETVVLYLVLKWWAIGDLNTGPHPYQGCALAN